jgi:C1A family cysteine protease
MIDEGHRVVAGFYMFKDQSKETVWGIKNGAIKASLENQNSDFSQQLCPSSGGCTGHEMIIIGYNDNAKVLKLRNSWGPDRGDNGDFYMSYDYYQLMVNDAWVIGLGGGASDGVYPRN